MPRPARVLQVFVSSPGDVTAERHAVVRAVEGLRHDPFVAARYVPRAVGHDLPGVGIALLAGTPPQEQIDEEMPRPRDCDVVVVIFGGRMGTPAMIDGTAYPSGTAREYQDAVSRPRWRRRPAVLVYRRSPLPPVPDDAPDRDGQLDQRNRLDAFFRETFDAPGGSLKGSYIRYADAGELAERVQADLRGVIARLDPARRRRQVAAGVALTCGLSTAGAGYWQWSRPPAAVMTGILEATPIPAPDDLDDAPPSEEASHDRQGQQDQDEVTL